MKQKDMFVAVAFFTFAIGLGLLVAQSPDVNADRFAQMEPAAGEEAIVTENENAPETGTIETEEGETDRTVVPMEAERIVEDNSPVEEEIPASEIPKDTMNMYDHVTDEEGDGQPEGTQEETAPSIEPAPYYGEDTSAVHNYNLEEALEIRFIGSPNAPYTVYEFSSLSCPHCATFHEDTYPKIKKAFIDTGKIRWAYVPFPNNKPALMGAMIAQCVHPRRFERVLALLHNNQKRWAFSSDPESALFDLVRIAGIDFDFYQKCLSDDMLQAGLVNRMREFSHKHNITGTPSFVFEPGGYKLSGALSFSTFADKFQTIVRITERDAAAQQEE